jgi:hypothetical protein
MNSEMIPVNTIQAAASGIQEIERVTGRSRYYLVDEKKLPSVTTILSAVYPKPALYNWYAKRGREAVAEYLGDYISEPISYGLLENAVAEAKLKPAKEAQEAADLGSLAHELISEELQGNVLPVPVVLEPVMDSFHRWQDTEKLTLVDTEVAIFGEGYAGTIDALYTRPDGSYLLAEIKTSKRIYDDHPLQAWAYMDAIFCSTNDHINPNLIMDAHIIRLGKEVPEWEVVYVDGKRQKPIWDAALAFYHALKGA